MENEPPPSSGTPPINRGRIIKSTIPTTAPLFIGELSVGLRGLNKGRRSQIGRRPEGLKFSILKYPLSVCIESQKFPNLNILYSNLQATHALPQKYTLSVCIHPHKVQKIQPPPKAQKRKTQIQFHLVISKKCSNFVVTYYSNKNPTL